jgi:nucleotide-binding universal stress UspA family protein
LDPADGAPAIEYKTVVCGVDASPQSAEAPRQALAIAEQDADIWAVSVWSSREAMAAGIHASDVTIDLRSQAESALRAAVADDPRIRPILVRGPDVAGLLTTAVDLEADLICVAAHGRSRPAGILFGSVATAMAHHAPCSVLICREPSSRPFPQLIVHATDGSPESLAAAQVAGEIAARHDSTVVTLHVSDGSGEGQGVAEEAVRILEACGREPVMRVEQGSAKRRIVETAAEAGASLVVLGSRGKTGVAAIGSVSEHVAHRAPCSTLIVRPTEHPARDENLASA